MMDRYIKALSGNVHATVEMSAYDWQLVLIALRRAAESEEKGQKEVADGTLGGVNTFRVVLNSLSNELTRVTHYSFRG